MNPSPITSAFREAVEAVKEAKHLTGLDYYRIGDRVAGEGRIRNIAFVQGSTFADGTVEGAVILFFDTGATGSSFVTIHPKTP